MNATKVFRPAPTRYEQVTATEIQRCRSIKSVWDAHEKRSISKRKVLTEDQLATYVQTAVWVSTLRTYPMVREHSTFGTWCDWIITEMHWSDPAHWRYLAVHVPQHNEKWLRFLHRAMPRQRKALAQLNTALREAWDAKRIVRLRA